MKPGDMVRKLFVTDLTNPNQKIGIIIGADELNFIIMWNNGVIRDIFRDDLEKLYEVISR